jgi:hypothetical protein
MAGTAKWCLNQPSAAVDEWRAGVECEFADAAGGVKVPLLLLFASIAQPKVIPKREAEELLAIRIRNPRARSWPGPAAEFVLGRIDENRLRRQAFHKNESACAVHQALSDFCVGLVHCMRGERAECVGCLKNVAAVSWSDYDFRKRVFLGRIWQEELFLARHESSVWRPNGT